MSRALRDMAVLPSCDWKGASRWAMRRGAVPILSRSSELRRRSKLLALDHIRSDL